MRYFIIAIMSVTFAFAGDAKPLPADAQAVIDKMESQINKIRQETAYKLDTLIGAAMKNNNLDLAIVLKDKQKEIVEAMPKLDIFGDAHGVVGKWLVNLGGWHDYKADGMAIHSNGAEGKWRINNNKLLVTWGPGSIDTFTLPVKNNILSGATIKGQSFTITKVVAK